MLADLRDIFTHEQVLVELIKRDLKTRYKRSLLGVIWTILTPLLLLGVTATAFSALFEPAENYLTYLLSGLVMWTFFAQATGAASTSMLSGAGLVRKVYLPPALFPLAAVNAAAVTLVLSLVPLFLLMAATGARFTWALLCLPIAMVLAVLFTYGVALFLAAASVFFHDTIHLYQVVLTAWFYLTPVIYPTDIVPPNRWLIFHANPMFHIVQVFRDPIVLGVWPPPIILALATLSAFGTAAFGWWFFERSSDEFTKYL